LRPNPRNARTHSKRQLKLIASSIRAFGFIDPIIVDKDGMILAGHGRWLAAKELGLEWAPIIRIEHLTETQKRAYALAANKIALEAGWDDDLLSLELGELAVFLPREGYELSVTGFEVPEFDAFIGNAQKSSPPVEHEVPLAPQKPVSRPGDLWVMGKRNHRLICADARDPAAVARLLADKRVDVIFADPPYNVRVRGIVGRGRTKHDEFAFASGEMSSDQFRSFLLECLSIAIAHSLDGAIHYVCMDWRHIGDLLAVAEELYGAFLNICVWDKKTPGQGSFYRSQHELVGVFRVGDEAHTNNIRLGQFGRNRSNIWTYPGVNSFGKGRMDALTSHPTVKPTQLVVDALLDCTARGALVLDPFMGSGTTILAAEKIGRQAFGVEYEPRYVDVAIRRWEALTKRETVLEGDGRTFAEIAAERAAASLSDAATSAPPNPASGSKDDA
jgi:DNA modification methylase